MEMTQVYYYLVLTNAAVALGAAAAAYWRNRFHAMGPLFGLSLFWLAVWLVGFAQYFVPRSEPAELLWARITLMASIINHPFIGHAVCAFVGKSQRLKWWLWLLYLVTGLLVVLLWNGQLITGLRQIPQMDHYVAYNRQLYPWLSAYYMAVILFGLIVWALSARQQTGYRRMQMVYFILAWTFIGGTTNWVILPIEYGINMQPIGFFVMPVSMAFLTYVLAKTRVADYNIVIARALLFTVMLLVVVVLCLIFVGGLVVLAPGFMDQKQVVLTVVLMMVIGLVLSIILPWFLPQAERLMQERLLGGRLEYQEALTSLTKEVGRESTIDQLLEKVAVTIHEQMQLSRVLVLIQDPISAEYQVLSQVGVKASELTNALNLPENGSVVRWLREHKDVLVRDELARSAAPRIWVELSGELNQLQASVCVPMILNEGLTGLFVLGEKLNRDMFFVSDLRLLSTLATEVAMGVRFRRMEDQAVRNNKLVALGTIAAGVAHEIRNPLASIRTFAQLLPSSHNDPEFRDEFSKLVLQDVDRITKVIQSMLSFARPATMNIATHTAEELIDEALTLVQPRLRGKQIEVSKQLPHQLTLSVDKQQILQVLLNILNNAVDALSNGGAIRITTGMLPLANKNNSSEPSLAIIEIADNGPGVPAAARPRLFDPFFTTKPEGTGLGLSISQKIVRDHNGFISVSSVEGMGTAFQIHLPLEKSAGSGDQ